MGSRFDLENARLPELLPYQRSFAENDHEAEIQALAIALFNEHIAPTMFDVNVLGNPHLGSIDLVRRSVNADGLALLSGEGEAAETRFLYRAWKGRNRNGRGLQFFRAYMQMLYPNAWRVNQLYQDPSLPYGLGMLTEAEVAGQYGSGVDADDLVLTSRVRVSIDYNAPLATSFSEMRKILQSVLPARLTPEFSTKIDVRTDGLGMGSDAIGIAHIIDVPTPFHCGLSARSAITQAQFIIKPDPPASLNVSAQSRASALSAGPLVLRPEPMPPDAWRAWAKPSAPAQRAGLALHIRSAVIVRLDEQSALHAAAVGQVAFSAGPLVLRPEPMPPDAWRAWADFVAVPEEGTVDDFYAGMLSGYASRQLPNWSYGPDSTASVVQLLNQGLLPL